MSDDETTDEPSDGELGDEPDEEFDNEGDEFADEDESDTAGADEAGAWELLKRRVAENRKLSTENRRLLLPSRR